MERTAEPRRTGAFACLWRAGDTLRRDPVGVLLPAGGILLLQLLLVSALRELWLGRLEAPALLCGIALLRVMGGAALRSRLLAVGARAAGMPSPAWGRPWALLGVELIVGPLAAAAAAAVGIPTLALAAGIVAQGWYTTGAAIGAIGIGLATGAALVVRAVFALAPAQVIVDGRSALGALAQSASRAPYQLGALVTVLLAGDLLIAFGGLLCGASVLPGYPISDLALLHRWREEGGSR